MAQIELQLTLPRDARYVTAVRRMSETLLRDVKVPEDSIGDITVALSEACSNVIRHAAGTSQYGVRLSVDAHECSIEVRDLGPGFDAGAMTEQATLDEVASAEDGRGLSLLHALMDHLEFVREEDTTTVRLVKRWDEVGFDHGAVAD